METFKPTIRKGTDYVIIGSVDHGFQIPAEGVKELVSSLEGVVALMMETPKEFSAHMHPMSTESLVKAATGHAPTSYLPGNRADEDIGEGVLKYAPQDIAEVFVPCLYVRNSCQMGHQPTFESIIAFTSVYQKRFGFIDVERTIKRYMQVLQHWDAHQLDANDLDHFSYDFEKFFGDIKEYEFWLPALKVFREKFEGKVGACVGDYHVPFVQSVFEGKEQKPPHWESHIDTRREDLHTPQDAAFLRQVYAHISEALST